MKNILSLLSILCIFIGFAQNQGGHHCAHLKSQAMHKVSAKSINDFGEMNKYDVISQILDLEIENTSTYVIGSTIFEAKALESFNQFVCELDTNLAISEVKYNNIITTFSRDGDRELIIDLPSTTTANQIFYIEISYEGLPSDGTGFFSETGIFNDQSPSWGADVTWTLSEPYAAHTWFPCKQVLEDKLDSVEVNITTSNTNMAGSNGVLQNVVDLGNGKSRYEWKSNYPIAYYLVSIAVGPYIDYSFKVKPDGAADSILVQNFIYDNPATLQNFEADILETGDMIHLFSELYGMYPFAEEKYGHCMAPLSGGMEHQTMTTQGFFTPWLTAHELGHQWWGDQVTCSDWRDIWVNEGFASYSEYLYTQSVDQVQADADMLGVHNNVMSQAGGSVYVDDITDPDRIFSSRLTYDKGNALVHMLRHWVNDDLVFFQALRDFQELYKMQNATGDDFKEVISEATLYNMDNFFTHWYYGEGFPNIELEYDDYGQDLFLLKLNQTGSVDNITPFFETFIEVRLNYDNGTDSLLRLFNHIDGQNYLLDIPNTVASVELDPNNWILNESIVTNNTSLAYDPALVGNNQPDIIIVEPVDTTTNPIDTTGINDSYLEKSLNIYPNPTKDKVTIAWNTNEFLTVNVFDIRGKKIDVAYSYNQTQIDMSNWSGGAYIFKIFNKNYTVVRKVLKE